MKHTISQFIVFGGVVAALAVGHAASRRDVMLGVSGRANAAASVAAAGKVAIVAWAATAPGGSTDIYAARSGDGGRTFGAPVRVNDVAGDASVGGEQPPHVALVSRASGAPSVIVVWTAKRKEGTRILSARSDDGGATFGKARPLAGGEAAGNRGWEAIATDRDGRVVSVWLGSPRDGGGIVSADAARGPRPLERRQGPGRWRRSGADVEAVFFAGGRR